MHAQKATPSFVNEIIRLHAQEGLENSQEMGIRIPEGVRVVMGRRLNLLGREQ